MIIDVTGIELTPGRNGESCLGNGKHTDDRGFIIECCCDVRLYDELLGETRW